MQERHLESWLAQLDALETFARDNVTTFHPGHGPAGDGALIGGTRAYLRAFAEALKTGDAEAVEQRVLAAYPGQHARQFLTAFSIPACFPVGKG